MWQLSIHLDVYADLHDRSVREAANRLHNDLERAGQRAGDGWGRAFGPQVEKSMARVEKATDKVADAMGNVRREQARYDDLLKSGDNDRTKLITQSERLASAKRREAAAVREAARVHRDHNVVSAMAAESMLTMTSAAGSATRSVSNLGEAMTKMARGAAGGAALGGITGVAWAATKALSDVGQAVVTASQSLWLLPAAAGAAGVGFAALKIGTLGFADAIKDIRDPEKFAEALQSLSPNAQQAALSIQSLLPQFDSLKNSVQDSLFVNVSGEIQRLSNQFLPMLQSSLSGVASAFNTAFQGVAGALSSNPELISNILGNIQAGFQNAAAAAAPFTEALLRITEVGSTFLPQLGTALADAASDFAGKVSEWAESGELETWIEDGIAAAKELAATIFDIGKVVYDTFGSAKPGEFKDTLDGIVTAADNVASFINFVASAWDKFGRAAQSGINTAIGAVEALLNPLRTVANILNQLPGVNIDVSAIPGVNLPRVGAPIAGTPVAAPALGSGAGGGIGGVGAGTLAGSGIVGLPSTNPFAVPTPSGDGSRGGPKLPDAPVVPYDSTVPGGSNPATFAAETSFLDARQKLAEKRARLEQLEKSSEATEQDRLAARNEVIEAERDFQGAEIRLNEARADMFKKSTKASERYASQMGQIGAQLDQDFGISKGLAGIAENITKFVANLAAAPLLGQLDAVSRANPTQGGHGLMGMLGAQGVFGPQYQNNQYADQQQQQSYGLAASAMGPAALMPGMGSPGAAKPGESARAFAHRVMKPYFESQGLTVGDHAADQFGEHQNGALDIMVDSIAEGQQVLQQVLSDPNVYGAIFDNKTYGYGHGLTPRNYSAGNTGNPTQDHQDHVHAWYKPGGGNNIPAMPGAAMPSLAAAPSYAYAPSAPLPTSFGGGGPMAAGMPQSAPFTPTQYGGITPTGGSGAGGVGIDSGGAIGMAMQAGGMALDAMAPGAGQAAQMGIKLANRAIQYGGQVAGIGVQGLMETFLPTGGSELANNNWITRIVGGLAGAAPALPNLAGKSAQAPTQDQVAAVNPNTTQHGQGSNPGPGNTYRDINVTTTRDDGGGVGRDIAASLLAQHAGPGM